MINQFMINTFFKYLKFESHNDTFLAMSFFFLR